MRKISWHTLFFLFITANIFAYNKNSVDSLNFVLFKTKTDTAKASIFLALANQYYFYDNDSALFYANKSFDFAQKANYLPLKLKAKNFTGIVLLFKAEYFQSEKIFKELIRDANLNQDSAILAKSIANLGLTYYYQGEYDKSLPYFFQALTLSEKLDLISLTNNTLSNIANVYLLQNKYDKALEINLKSLKLAIERKNKKAEANILNSLGLIYSNKKDEKNALLSFRKSLKIKEELNDINGQISTLLNISDNYNAAKNYAEAILYLEKAERLAREIDDKEKIIQALMTKGLIAFNKKQLAKAELNFLEAEKMAIQINSKQQQMESALQLYSVYKQNKNLAKAINYLEKYSDLKDAIFNEENSQQMAEMEAKYENDKKQKEILLLENQKQLQESELEKKDVEAKKNKILLLTFIAGFVLVVVSLVVSIRAFNQKKKANLLLAQQKNEIEHQKQEIEVQKHIVDEKQKEILDSINYAKRIQYALLASDNLLEKHLPEYFVLFNPKDVVSGDFYWASPTKNGFVYVTADCTGHGVPGAFMSLLNISKLSQTINENKINQPDLILNNVRTEIINALNPKGSLIESKDGMDAVVCKINFEKMKLEYAAANNSFYIVRNKEVIVCKADKMPVGIGYNNDSDFTHNLIDIVKGDCIYTFTDGYADQFGGPKGKKFKYKPLEELLVANCHLPMNEQQEILQNQLTTWKGNLEQIDDVLVIGVRV